jgi:hypothetical protein
MVNVQCLTHFDMCLVCVTVAEMTHRGVLSNADIRVYNVDSGKVDLYIFCVLFFSIVGFYDLMFPYVSNRQFFFLPHNNKKNGEMTISYLIIIH